MERNMDPLEEWEMRETRGFVMRKGYCKRLERRRRPDAPKETCGRNSFSRRAGGHRDVLRCGMCKPGRHHGDGGAKALKKVRGGERTAWLAVVDEARLGEQGRWMDEVPKVFQSSKSLVQHYLGQAPNIVPLSNTFTNAIANSVSLGDFCQHILPSAEVVLCEPCPDPPQLCYGGCRCHRKSQRASRRRDRCLAPTQLVQQSLSLSSVESEETAWVLV